MLLVKTFVAQSPINGLGLFAAVDIAPGTAWWRLDGRIDGIFSEAEFAALPEMARQHVRHSGFLQKGTWVMCGDDARFVNHAFDTPSRPDTNGMASVTVRPIRAGEEITEDYTQFDENVRDFMLRAA